MKSKCKRCGQPHPRCSAHNGAKLPCGKWPVKGANVCATHGGSSPLAKAKAAERLEKARLAKIAEREIRRFVPDTGASPMTAILDLVQYQSGVVAYWRRKVEEIEDERDLVWGTVYEEEVENRFGTFGTIRNQATAPMAYKLLREAQQDLANYASTALRAGFEERQVALAEKQGELLVAVIKGVLAGLKLTREQQELVPIVVPEQLRLAQRR